MTQIQTLCSMLCNELSQMPWNEQVSTTRRVNAHLLEHLAYQAVYAENNEDARTLFILSNDLVKQLGNLETRVRERTKFSQATRSADTAID